jgi:DNA-binding transcriptional LysR family regulator
VVDKVEDLKTYLAVLDAGGVNAAAAELGIAKSAVSRRLSDLEKRLGLNLLDRSTRKFEPTAVGAEYARRAREILAALEELDASMTPGGIGRTVTILAPAEIIAYKLIPALRAVRDHQPGVSIRFLAEDDGSGTDVLIGSGRGQLLFTSRLILCASPAHLKNAGTPRSSQDLDAHAAIVIEDGTPARWRVGGAERKMACTATIVPDGQAALAAAAAGLGVAQLPDYLAATAVAEGRLIELLQGQAVPTTSWSASFGKGADLDVRKLLDALAASLA